MRRCTRLTNAYSKKLENYRAAIALWIAFYNLCRVHETLRCTPAMALGVTDHVWSVAELLKSALEPSGVPPLPRPTPETTLRPGARPLRLIIGRGGKGTNKSIVRSLTRARFDRILSAWSFWFFHNRHMSCAWLRQFRRNFLGNIFHSQLDSGLFPAVVRQRTFRT